MAMQFVLTIDLPHVSVGRVASYEALDVQPALAPTPALVWPIDGAPAREPSARASWKLKDGQLRMVWA